MEVTSASVADVGARSFGGDGDDGLLRTAVMNELIAPEVLAFQTDLITKTKDFINSEVHPFSLLASRL
jgi:hypothetical protein